MTFEEFLSIIGGIVGGAALIGGLATALKAGFQAYQYHRINRKVPLPMLLFALFSLPIGFAIAGVIAMSTNYFAVNFASDIEGVRQSGINGFGIGLVSCGLYLRFSGWMRTKK